MGLYCVYILASDHRTLYTGVTGNLERRLTEHRMGVVEGFTRKYNCDRLVFFEVAENAVSAIDREKQIKSWARWKKVALIEARNPE